MSGRRPTAPTTYSYVAAADISGRPHVVVDGAARPGTVCTLSHWPGTPTPRKLWADTSAEIVLRALRRPRLLPSSTGIATLDHYDADGVIALGLLVTDGLAKASGERLAGAARAGDFQVVRRRDDALVAFALGAVPGAVALGAVPGAVAEIGIAGGAASAAADATAVAARSALEVLPVLAGSPQKFEHLWGPEAEAYDRARRMVEKGAVVVEERPAADLAVVRVDEAGPEASGARWEGAAIHPAAVYGLTSCLRVATLVGRRYELCFRYETWVRLVTRRPRPRVDLSALALALTGAEADAGPWEFDGAGAIVPRLRRADGGPSTLTPEQFLSKVTDVLSELDRGPSAWDPYARDQHARDLHAGVAAP